MTEPTRPRVLRALRGATTVSADRADEIAAATTELIAEIASRNALAVDDVVSAVFTVTGDLTSDYPARAAREAGWHDVPFLCAVEMPATGALERCIRLLVHVTTDRTRAELRHVYLRGARTLRPDIAD